MKRPRHLILALALAFFVAMPSHPALAYGIGHNSEYLAKEAPPSERDAFATDEKSEAAAPTDSSASTFATLVCCAIVLFCYFIPTLVAAIRGHQQALAIFVLNLLLGWSGLGWVLALIWACTAVHKQPSAQWSGVEGKPSSTAPRALP